MYSQIREPSERSESPSEELSTPRLSMSTSSRIQFRRPLSIQGPNGPHLFRHSFDSAKSLSYDQALQLSPLFPKKADEYASLVLQPPVQSPVQSPLQSPVKAKPKSLGDLKFAVAAVNSSEVQQWSSRDVASWMFSTGFEESIVQKFTDHDITGPLLLGMQKQDLKELDIASFGKRHHIWKEICALREDRSFSPVPTIIEDASRPNSRAATARSRSRSRRRGLNRSIREDDPAKVTKKGTRRGRIPRRVAAVDTVVVDGPDPISIVAIEQFLPKPHKCSKGQNCHKWKKQQRLREQINHDFNVNISPDEGGFFLLAGNPGNAKTAPNMLAEPPFSPTSQIIPSLVASSDVLGPSQMPRLSLQEEVLSMIDIRDPLENVKRFIEFQHLNIPAEIPPLPTTDIFDAEAAAPVAVPTQQHSHENLRRLPKLSIPRSISADPLTSALSSSCDTPAPFSHLHHLRTAASDLDISRNIDLLPPGRDISSSVPPNMHFRQQIINPNPRQIPLWRRPSLNLPTLPENSTLSAHLTPLLEPPTTSPSSPEAVQTQPDTSPPPQTTYTPSTTHTGWLSKRRARLLRHEWTRNHYRLNGTHLTSYSTSNPTDASPLESINIDDYFVSCSSRTGNGKLAAALKALHLSRGTESGPEEARFAFQLVPQEGRGKLGLGWGEGKTQWFAAGRKEERVEWMREVMLAKALRQREEGFRVTVNGRVM